MRFAALMALALTALMLSNPSRAAISLDQAMAHPDWIGPPVESAWWAWDSQRVQYALKRKGSPLRDTYVQAIDAAQGEAVGDAGLAGLDAEAPVYSRDRSRMLFLRHGDLFERDLRSGALTQITRSNEQEADPRYAAADRGAIFRVGNDWYRWSVEPGLLTPVALPRAEKDPNAAAEPDASRDMQLRLITTLKRQKDERDALRARAEQERKADPSRPSTPVYLGTDIQIDGSALSPNGRWLLLATSAKGAEVGRIAKLQKYVTESGYEESEDERTRVGRNPPAAQTLKLVDLTSGSVRDLSYDALPGIATDPMAALRQAQKLEPLEGPRPVRIGADENSSSAIRWSEDGSRAVVLIRAIDNKDRWLATVNVSTADLASARLESVHRLTDPAWINWAFNEFGWLPDNETLWYLSEESGYSHLYTAAPQAKPRAVTAGEWETSSVQWSADGATAYFLCNRKWPGDYEVCAAPRAGGTVRELTELDGVEDFVLSPDGEKLLIR
jgi:dipeptidyl aminopeptidase/acylaminoacyl peptidase